MYMSFGVKEFEAAGGGLLDGVSRVGVMDAEDEP